MDCDVLIVGAGPAGIATWLHLQRLAPALAARSVIIDRATFPRDKPCAGAVDRRFLRGLEDLGADLAIPGVAVDEIVFRLGDEQWHKRDHRFVVYDRRELDHALVRCARSRGLDLREAERFESLDRLDGTLRVRTDRAEYAPALLVGADGSLGRVQRYMGHQPARRPCATLMVHDETPAADPLGTDDVLLFDFTPVTHGVHGYVWRFPFPRDGSPARTHGIFDSGVIRQREPAPIREVFLEALRAQGLTAGAEPQAHPIRWHDGVGPLSAPRVLFVGDAAGAEAATGGGLHLALWYGDVAAATIADAVTRGDFSFTDYSRRVRAHSLGEALRSRHALALRLYGDPGSTRDAVREMAG